MAKKRKKRSAGRLQDQQYDQIISEERPEAEKLAQKLGVLTTPLAEIPYSRRISAQTAIMRAGVDTSPYSAPPDLSHLKEREQIIAYYARPDIQREMYRYAKGRSVTVLRNFRPLYSALRQPDDVLPLMFHYLKGNRWPSMHGAIERYNEAGQRICDFVFEPDYKKSWSVAFGAARPIVKLFLGMGLPFFIKFSGNSSPHIIVPGEALATAGERGMKTHEFRQVVYEFVMSHMDKPGLLDGANWRPTHFLRLAYSIHELGGKVSMPIEPEEFDSFNPNKARLENVTVIENWWHIPEDAAERGRGFIQRVLKNYPRLVRGVGKPEPEHKWKPPTVPRKLRQIFDANWYAKVLANGQELLASAGSGMTRKQRTAEEVPDGEMAKALAMLKRWQDAGLEADLKTAAEVFEIDAAELQRHWQTAQSAEDDDISTPDDQIRAASTAEYYSRSEVQEAIYDFSVGRCFRVAGAKAHFRLQRPADIPLLSAFFQSSDAKWRGFECTRAIYSPMDNQIAACSIGMEVDFSRSDYVSAVELAQAMIAVLQRYEVFCFVKFDGSEILELIIPAQALPKRIDGQETVLQMHQIALGLNRGFRRMPEVSGNDCILLIRPYGYTRPAYSINPETGLACVILTPDELQDFSPENAAPDRVSITRSWLDVPADASLQAQRFLKYALSPKWQPGLAWLLS